jgi:hypothetical protein
LTLLTFGLPMIMASIPSILFACKSDFERCLHICVGD